MTATNINIEEFIHVLEMLKRKGHSLMDLDMLPDDNHPNMNKLVVHPVQVTESTEKERPVASKEIIKNPVIDRSNNDIFSNKYFGL